MQSSDLECELSEHPDKTFVQKLIHDLCHGCAIGYTRPQISYSVNNLISTYQDELKSIF